MAYSRFQKPWYSEYKVIIIQWYSKKLKISQKRFKTIWSRLIFFVKLNKCCIVIEYNLASYAKIVKWIKAGHSLVIYLCFISAAL